MKRKRIYIKNEKLFAKPIRLSPTERRQVGVTQEVRKYVQGFQAKGLKGIEIAKAIVKDIKSFEVEVLHLEQAKGLWTKRSASQIIKSRKQIRMIPAEAAKTRKPSIMGCTDLSLAMVASFRAAGFPTLIVRAGIHTYAKFLYKGKVWIANPRKTKRDMVRQMTAADKKIENQYRAENAFAEGTSLAEIGITSYNDFFKYEYKKRQRR